jgi:hypothetical protein
VLAEDGVVRAGLDRGLEGLLADAAAAAGDGTGRAVVYRQLDETARVESGERAGERNEQARATERE